MRYAKIEEYSSDDGESRITHDPYTDVFETYIRGTRDPLYVGTSAKDARESLGLSDEEWNGILMSDPA